MKLLHMKLELGLSAFHETKTYLNFSFRAWLSITGLVPPSLCYTDTFKVLIESRGLQS